MQVKKIVESPDEGVVLVGMSAYALVLIDHIRPPLTVPPPPSAARPVIRAGVLTSLFS